jgi:hypothetical protein
MAPLGERSLEATNLIGARGMTGTVASSNGLRRWVIPAARSPPTPRHRRRTRRRSGGFREESPEAHRVAVALGERTQLAQGKRPPAATLGDEDPRPEALRARKFARFAGALPSSRAGPADGLGFFVSGSRPSFWISGARANRRLFPLRCSHRCCSSARFAASRRDGAKRSAQTVAMQRFKCCSNTHTARADGSNQRQASAKTGSNWDNKAHLTSVSFRSIDTV